MPPAMPAHDSAHLRRRTWIRLHCGAYLDASRIVMISPRNSRVTISTDIGQVGREQFFWCDFSTPDQAEDYADMLHSQILDATGVDDNDD